jgi:competence protein ComEC
MFLQLGRRRASWFSIILIWVYIVLTGLTTSGIRAGIMGSIFIIAGAFGRQNTNSRTIVLACAAMLLQNPLLLIYDIGFQLSFMACLGIIYLRPIIKYFLKSDIVAATFSAQIFTLPIMIFNFGTISLVAPITSMLILPVMPAILSFGFLFSIFAAISKILGWIFFVPCYLLVSYFLEVMNIFSQPWMEKSILNVSWIWILLAYLMLGFFTWFLNKKFSQKFI